MAARASLTVVIPVIDDGAALSDLLADLVAQRGVEPDIVVADGGSDDDSIAVARAYGVRVVHARRGRGAQMNAGAEAARGDWLCFLHADSRLTHPRQLRSAIDRLAAQDDAHVAGHFAVRFSRTASAHGFFYRYLEAKSATGRRHTIHGDQGLLLRHDFFDALGGFDTRLPFLEDQRMAAAIEAGGRWCLLEHRIETSARRFEREGEGARYLLMALIMAMYVADVPAFFERARGVYARPANTRRLALMPYFRLLRALMRDCGPRASLAVAWRIAGATLAQSWQLFFALDVALEPLLGPRLCLTRLHDRVLRYLIVHPPGQALLLVLLMPTIFGPLQLWCAWRERRRLAP